MTLRAHVGPLVKLACATFQMAYTTLQLVYTIFLVECQTLDRPLDIKSKTVQIITNVFYKKTFSDYSFLHAGDESVAITFEKLMAHQYGTDNEALQ